MPFYGHPLSSPPSSKQNIRRYGRAVSARPPRALCDGSKRVEAGGKRDGLPPWAAENRSPGARASRCGVACVSPARPPHRPLPSMPTVLGFLIGYSNVGRRGHRVPRYFASSFFDKGSMESTEAASTRRLALRGAIAACSKQVHPKLSGAVLRVVCAELLRSSIWHHHLPQRRGQVSSR